MRLRFLGANRQVTGSRTLLEIGSRRFLIDCGMFQERVHLGRNWAKSPLPPRDVEAVILTHAHLDHVGLLPRFVAQGYRGRVVTTEPSVDLAKIVLEDAAKIQMEDAAYKKRRHAKEKRHGPHPEVPLYTDDDVEKTLPLFEGFPYDHEVDLGGGVRVVFREAGHILGSALVEIRVGEPPAERRIIFSGDLGQWDKPLIGDPTLVERADVVILESTYGGRRHGSHGDPVENLGAVVNRVAKVRGTLVVPTFAVERAQELTYHFGRLVHEGAIPALPVYLDSPMAVDVTEVFRRHRDYLDEDTQALFDRGEPPLKFPGLELVSRREDSMAINAVKGPKVILASSGMCTGGRVKHHLRQMLSDPNSTVLFVGYQANGTLGRQILEGSHRVRIHGRYMNVRAQVAHLNGFSAHGDEPDLLRWLAGFREGPARVFLNHGEADASEALARSIREQREIPVDIPRYGESFEL